jgi:hypothetical protein
MRTYLKHSLLALAGLAFINPPVTWGMIFTKFFDTTINKVYNVARNGWSTRSFLAEKRWEPVMEKLQPGD